MTEPEIGSVRQAIDRMADTRGDAVFLISPETGRALTFADLKDQCLAIWARLREAGLEPGDKVGLLLDNGLFTVQLFLGTMYAGLVSVPLNVRSGVTQLTSTLDHCDAKVLFVEDQYRAVAAEAVGAASSAPQVIIADIDSSGDGTITSFDSVPPGEPEEDDAALLMYSSGTVGRPKAAIHSHSTLLAHGHNSILSHKLSHADRSLLVLPLYHINAECVTLLPTLLSGGSVVVPHHFSVSQFWDWLDEYSCTWSALVPTIIAQLLDWKDPRPERREAALERVRFFRCSSAPLSPSLHREFMDKFDVLLIQAMGSTEAGNIFSNPLPPGENKIGSPGLAWGFETRIVDRAGTDVAAGEPGEVLIRGPALMRGYYKDDDGTAAVLDPEGWLHTGDLAYQDQGGYFFVVGRTKELIIKGGVNIAPRQIDEVLESHPAVLEAAVVGVPDRYVGEDVVAFAVLRSGMKADERAMLGFCEAGLGHFKTPSRIYFVADLPKGPSGKVQRLHLLEEAASRARAATLYSGDSATQRAQPGPARTVGQMIAESWGEVLGKAHIDLDSNFFSLGANSIMAIKCLSKLREKLPVVLSLSDFFENPTVAQQAALVERRLNEAGRAAPNPGSKSSSPAGEQISIQAIAQPSKEQPIRPRAQISPYPLSAAQRRIWYFAKLAPDVPLYNESDAVRLRGDLDIGALEQALDAIVARRQVLRTTIHDTESGPMARVHESWPLRIKQIDLSGLAAMQAEAEVERLLVDEPRRLYDLKSEPGIRLTVIRLRAREHVLILMMHHIVSDRWSMGLVSRELAALYQAAVSGKAPALSPLPIQYGDYVVWQSQRLADADFARELAYWEENLCGVPDLLELPTDRPRPPVQSYRGARRWFRLGTGLAERLRDRSRQEKTSLFNIFAAAFNTLLYRYTGSEDLVVGIPVADRDRQEAESLIGFLIDTHALRTRVSADMTFRELLACVRTGLVDLYSHREVPFDQVVNRIRPERSLSHSPLFQVMLNWRDRDQQLPFIGLPGLEVEPLLSQTKTSKFDMTLVFTDSGNDILLETEYNTDLFDEDRIVRMIGHYRTLLEAAVADPGQSLAKLPLLTEAERKELADRGQTALACRRDQSPHKRSHRRGGSLHELFEEQAARAPHAVAVVFEGVRLTYRQLNRRANQLANALRELGVQSGDLVGICLDRSLDIVVGLLGILKAGGGYVPLDPAYPHERLAFMVQDARVEIIVTQESLQEKLPARGARLFSLDGDRAEIERQSSEDPESATTPDDLAYVIYTSGSTGRPKGVAITHYNVVRLFQSTENWFGFGGQDVWTLFHSISFDFSVFEIWGALLYGGRLVVVPYLVSRSPELFYELLSRERVSVLCQTPSAFLPLMRHDTETAQPRDLALRLVVFGGEGLEFSTLAQWFERHGDECPRLVNMYGITETTVHVTYRPVTQADAAAGGSRVGVPIPDLQLHILDEHLQPVPIGIPGEMCVGGAGLALGYLNRPELTAERFVADPFSDEPNARLYRSGDLARYLPDGDIEYLGRIDHQVKIRGFRIELGEIEVSLRLHPQVAQAAVLVREDEPGDKRLVAYVVLPDQHGPSPSVEELRAFLRERLPEYMVPAAFVALERLPLTPNGKLDRKALPAPDGGAYAWQAHEPPAGAVETVIAEIWAAVLGLGRVGRHDNFFDLGGHSLLAVRVLVRMREAGLQADVRALFAAPTLSAFAAEVAGQSGAIEVPPNLIPPRCAAITPEMLPLCCLSAAEIEQIAQTVPGGAANIQDIYPLLPLQEGILFHHLMAEDGDPYIIWKLISFADRAKLEAYVAALNAVIRRHDILRSSVVWEASSKPVQVVWRDAPLAVEEVDLDSADGEIGGQLRQRFDPRHHRLDLRRAPMMRLIVARDPATGRWLGIELRHHLIMDHTTVEAMRAEVQAHLMGSAEALPRPVPFRNFVVQALLEAKAEADEAFFRAMLGDVEETAAPFGVTEVYGGGSGVEEARVELDDALSRRLRSQGRALKVSAASLFHLAWGQVVARTCGREEAVFGTVVFGRMQGGAGADRALGPFINTLPVRIPLGERAVERCVRETHELLAELLMHEHASLAAAQRCSAVPAPLPLFTSLLNYRHGAGRSIGAGAAAQQIWTGIEDLGSEGRTNYPLMLAVDDHGEGFALTVQAAAGINAERVAAMMQQALGSLVAALEQTPDQPVGQLDVLPPEERHRLLVEWNATEADYPKDLCIHQLFEQQAARDPHAIAVVFEDRSLSYRELNARANQLAHELRHQGVKPRDLVGIFLERSPEIVVSLLAVLKAGGVYLPLDAAYPSDRLAFMMDDARVGVVLTQTSLRQKLPSNDVRFLCLDGDRAEIERQNRENPQGTVSAEDLAYVIYTSGSTGRPKGVAVPHAAVVNLLTAMGHELGFRPEDALLAVTALSFDIATLELLLPLLSGGRVIVADGQTAHDPQRLASLIEQSGCTVMQATPATWRMLVDAGWLGRPGLTLLSGGEALPRELADKMQTGCGTVWNVYGPTETTIWSTAHRVLSGLGSVPIGRPIGNTKAYILDPAGHPLPVGVVGELWIGGAGVARGYLNRSELTAERFVASPFVTGDRLYKTGDLGRYLANGDIEYLGRIDHQVKIRGFRIELGEIEVSLRLHPQVAQAAVLVREDEPGDKRLVAYVVPRDEVAAVPRLEELREFLRERLPEYMVPAAFVTLKRLPLTPNGKLDRKALPAPDGGHVDSHRGYIAPRSLIEEAVAQIWSKVLGRTRIGIDVNFFDLGGHSLLAVELLVEIKRALNYELPVPAFYQNPTIEGMARAIEEEKQLKQEPFLIPLRAGDSSAPIVILQVGPMLCQAARLLKGGRTVFATFVPWRTDLSQEEAAGQRVEDLAAPHAVLIREHLPSKRCVLVGHSFGGELAFEVAHQLQRQGLSVEAVLLLDAQTGIVLPWWEKLKPLSLDHVRRSLRHRANSARSRIRLMRAPLRQTSVADGTSLPQLEEASYKVGLRWPKAAFALLGNIVRNYRFRPLSCQAVLFQPEDVHAAYVASVWRKRFTRGVRIVRVPGDHHSMLQHPHTQGLATKINDVVEQLRLGEDPCPRRDLCEDRRDRAA